jgi:hypothetical protein
MPVATRAEYDAVLKEFYLGPLRNILNNETFLLSQIEQTSERVEGDEVVMAVLLGRNMGVGARGEYGDLPVAGRQRSKNVRFKPKYNYGSFELSGQLLKSVVSERGGFAKPLETETQGIVRDLKNDVNRQLYSDGSGILAKTGVTAGSTTVVAALTPNQRRQITAGMAIDIGTGVTPTSVASNREVSSVNAAGTQVVITGAAVTTAVTDNIYRSGSAGYEITGLKKAIAATGAYHGIDPATEPVWAAYVDDNGGAMRVTSEELWVKAWQEANLNSGEEIDLWVTDAKTHRDTAALLTGLKRFVNTVEVSGGYKGLDMTAVGQGNSSGKTVTLHYDKDCDPGVAYGLCKSTWHWDRMSDWEFMDDDGAILSRVVTSTGRKDAYAGTLYCYADIATDNRGANAALRNIGVVSPT